MPQYRDARGRFAVVADSTWQTAMNILITYTADEIVRSPTAFQAVMDYAGLTLHRVIYDDGTAWKYWLETPNGDRFALRYGQMHEFFRFLRGENSAREIYVWLDETAYEVSIIVDEIADLRTRGSRLGVPGYGVRLSPQEISGSGYNREDVEAIAAMIAAWEVAETNARVQLSLDGTIENCACPQCQFLAHEITYGEMLRSSAALNGTEPRYPSFDEPALRLNDMPTSVLQDLRLTRRPGRGLRTPAEGYYNDNGDWVTGRRPRAHMRLTDGSTSRYEYDSFSSDENTDYDDYNEEDFTRADRDRYGIAAWNYRQPISFYGQSSFGTFFGVELEICSDYANAVIPNRVPYIGCVKHDGSINGGFEIVTQPMSLDFVAEQSFDWIPALRDAGARAGRNGLHVHISRDGFASDWHRYKFISLWQDPRNYEEVKAFNRRHSTEYATPYTRLTAYRQARRIGVGEGSRYCMVNIQNRDTIEMRGPASTLNRIKLRGTIQGFAASVEYTRAMNSTQVALGGLQWSGFVQWATERPEYAAFIQYLDLLVEEGAPASVRAAHFVSL